MRFRLWPQSLRWRLVAVLLLSLLAAQAVGIAIFAGERDRAVVGVNRILVIDRTSAVVALLRVLPPEQHAAALKASSVRGFAATLGRFPAVGAYDERLPSFEQRMVKALEGFGTGEVRAAVPELPPPPDGRRERWKRGGPSLSLAVEIRPGAWLNLRHRMVPPPEGWARPVLGGLALTALFVGAAGAVTAARIARPLEALALSADRLGRGQDVEPLLERGSIESRRTARAFNRMQRRLKRYVEDRTHTLASVAHDLRTPVTALRLRAELLDDEEERSRFVATLDEMQAVIEGGLALAREESAVDDTAPVDLAALAREVAAEAGTGGAEVSLGDLAPVTIEARPLALKRAWRNLAENALRYAGPVTLGVEANASEVKLIASDRGPGIPDDQLERVQDPFVRLEASRSRETGGSGLGLAIARGVARAHGGRLGLSNRDGGGLRAEIVLPLR